MLQTGRLPKDGKAIPFVSDFFDFSVYIDADEDVLRAWYVERFLTLRDTAFRDPKSYFHRYAKLSDAEAAETATVDLVADQSRQSAREYFADAPARQTDPEKDHEPPGRAGGVAAAVSWSVTHALTIKRRPGVFLQSSSYRRNSHAVMPAKAGIQFFRRYVGLVRTKRKMLGTRFRGYDDWVVQSGTRLSLRA